METKETLVWHILCPVSFSFPPVRGGRREEEEHLGNDANQK